MSKVPAEDRRPGLRRRVGAIALGGVSLACMMGAVYAYGGCAGRVDRRSGTSDVAVFDVPAADAGGEVTHDDAVDGGNGCIDPMVFKVKLTGSFTRNTGFHPVIPDWPNVNAPLTTPVSLGRPRHAMEFSVADLCSAEDVSPSYIRLVCIGSQESLLTIEYRVGATSIVNLVNGTEHLDLPHRYYAAGCARLETEIPKRDLAPLAKAYLDDSPSERCAGSKAPRRKVSAKLRPYFDADSVWQLQMPCSNTKCCYDHSGVRLSIPLVNVGPFQNLGKLRSQCSGPCNAYRSKRPNGFGVNCFEGDSVEAYQLGDALYIVEDDHVRRVSLPCGIELDFQLKEFMAHLTPGNIDFSD